MILQAALRETRRSSLTLTECGSAQSECTFGLDEPLNHRRPGRFLPIAVLLILGWAMNACSTLRVPAAGPAFSAKEFTQTEAEGVILRARAIAGKESYSELFDDDLPQMGIIAVWICMENRSGQEVALNPEKWHVLTGGRRGPAMAPGEMIDRYYRERRIRFYTLRTDELARERLSKLSLQRGKLAPGTSAEGFVFFRMDDPAPTSWTLDASLMAEGVKLGGRRKLNMQLPLYAHS